MLNIENFTYSDSILQDLYLFLKSRNVNVYLPGVKAGECRNPYVVVKNNGGTKIPGISSGQTFYSIMCYVPKNNYSNLEAYVKEIKNIMKEIKPLFKFSGNETSSYYDDKIKAHMISIDYINVKKL